MSWRPAGNGARTRATELDFFTDRPNLLRLFVDRLNNDVAKDSRIIFFHGVGGAGKSLLLSHMEKRLCKRIDTNTWSAMARLDDERCVQQVIEATNYEHVPFTKLDFAPRPNISEDVRDSYQGLMKIRRDLGAAGVRCPLFDFAVITYLRRSNRSIKEQIEREFPENEVGFALEIAESLLSPIPFASLVTSVLNVSNSRLSGWFGERRIKSNLDRESIEIILTIDPEKELLPALPEMLAEDIVTYLSGPKAPPRIVMLFDTHEAFWERHRGEGAIMHEQRDEWLRRLLGGIADCDRIVAAVAGREVPRWTTAMTFPINADQIDLHLVGNLPDADARAYLDLRRITDSAIQELLMGEARVDEDQVHPFSLGLAADGYEALIKGGGRLNLQEFGELPGVDERRRRLIERFLQWVDVDIRDAVMALGLARSFDYHLYAYLGRTVGFPTSRAHFEVITGFSFTTPDPATAGASRMHDLLRRHLEESRDALTLETVRDLEAYFRKEETIERLEGRARIEAIYHRSTYDESGAGEEFVEVFNQALEMGRYETCRLLVELAGDMEIREPYPAVRMLKYVARHHEFMARYDAALERIALAWPLLERIEDNQGVAHYLRGDLLKVQGDAETGAGHHHAANAAFTDAIAAYDASLAVRPGHPGILTNKGNALFSLGELHTSQNNHETALRCLTDAIAAYGASLAARPGHPDTLTNEGNALLSLGELHTSQNNHETALRCLTDAIAAYDASLAAHPGHPDTLNNKGIALRNLGELHASQNNHETALRCLTDAIAACDASLATRPGHPGTLTNKGDALRNLGKLHASQNNHEAALRCLTDAIAAYDASLATRPGDPDTFTIKGIALLLLGRSHVSHGDNEAAIVAFQDAIAACDASLAARPNHPATKDQLRTTYAELGNAMIDLGDARSAADAHIASSEIARLALDEPPTPSAHNSIAWAFVNLARSQILLANYSAAMESVAQSLLFVNQGLRLDVDNAWLLGTKGSALHIQGEMHHREQDTGNAEQCFRDARALLSNALALLPGDAECLRDLGWSQARLGEIVEARGDRTDALSLYSDAISSLQECLIQRPKDRFALDAWSLAEQGRKRTNE